MKYWVTVYHNYGGQFDSEFSTKEEALDFAADQTGEDSYCKIIEGREVKFKIIKTGVEDVE